jgi:hypothetical protein
MTTDNPQTLRLDQLRIDGGTQPRVAIDEQVVADYAALYSNGVNLPPVTVFFDGATYWLSDGFHRYWANKRIDCEYVFADVRQGTQRDAILHSVGANADHGLRRTNADKRKAVLTLLEDEEWSKWTDREIGKRCGVDHKTVGAARHSLTGEIPQSKPSPRTYKTRHGTVARMKTGNINRHRNRGPDSPNPVRQPRPALAQTNLNLPHDPAYGARAIVAAMGVDYARQLIDSLTSYLQEKKEGDA